MKKQKTLIGTPESDLIAPIIQKVLKDDYRNVIIAVETKQGIIFKHKSKTSHNLAKELIDFLRKDLY